MIRRPQPLGTKVDSPANPESPTQRLKTLFQARLRRFEEKRFAARVCNEALAALQAIRARHPTLSGDALYEAVIARRLKLDAAAAHALMWRVHGSVENWEGDYVPKFFDVVKYMIVSEYVGQDASVEGMTLDLGPFLAPRIDPHL
jgi:hypothetical protein